jgi:serine protease
MPAENLDSTLHNYLVSRGRRSSGDSSPLRPEELGPVQEEALHRVERYLKFLKELDDPELRQAIDKHQTTILKGVQSGIAESTRSTTRGGEPPRKTRGMDLAKAALGERPSFLVINNEICLEGSLADPAGWQIALDRPEVRKALKPRLAGVGLLFDSSGTAVGTCFCLAPNLVMTNRHVAERVYQLESNTPGKYLKSRARWSIDFSRDPSITSTSQKAVFAKVTQLRLVAPDAIVAPSPDRATSFSQVDVAILEVEPLDGDELPVLPVNWTVMDEQESEILVVGHPYDDPAYRKQFNEEPKKIAISFDEVFGGKLYYKHVAPGHAKAYRIQTAGGQKAPGSFLPKSGIVHDASTLGGNSGSPILSLFGNHDVLGIHFWGQAVNRPNQIVNLGHSLGAVLDSPNHSGLSESGASLREVLDLAESGSAMMQSPQADIAGGGANLEMPARSIDPSARTKKSPVSGSRMVTRSISDRHR